MDAVFLSDLHLKSLNERNGQTLLRFLISLEESPKPPPQIFLLGDIFDLWVSDHSVFLDRYRPLLDVLDRLVKRGSKVFYFEGNHDLHLAPFWEKTLGAKVFVSAAEFEINGLKIRCEHGDEINRDDKNYLLLRSILRSPVIEFLTHRLPGVWIDGIGNRWSKHSRKRSSAERLEREQRIRKMLRRHAEIESDLSPFDVVISGHMHVKDDWSFSKGDRTLRSINLGSWFETQEVLTLEGKTFRWLDLSSTADLI